MRVERSQNVNFKANLTGQPELLKASTNVLKKGLGDIFTLEVAPPPSGNGAVITISKLIGKGLQQLGVHSFDASTLNTRPTKVLAVVQRSAGVAK